MYEIHRKDYKSIMSEENTASSKTNPWSWVPSLYFAEGIPYVLVMTVSVAMYKKLGVSNSDIALYTSLLYLPWVIKPLWGPLVDLYWTKRNWTTWLQLLMAILFFVLAATLNTPVWWFGSLGVFTLIAFASATHDIAADGFYMLGLTPHHQTLFTGIRSTFYRFAMIFGTGCLPIIAGMIETHTGPQPVVLDVRSGGTVETIRTIPQPAAPFIIAEPAGIVTLDPGTTMAMDLKLTAKPEKEMVVSIAASPSKWYGNLFPVGDDRLITMEGGDRIVFTPDNWSEPRHVVLHADEKISKPTQALFLAKAGNIPLSWVACFVLCGVLFLVISAWHFWALPKPASDHGMIHGQEKQTPFLQAATGLIMTIMVPIFVGIALYDGMMKYVNKFVDISTTSTPAIFITGLVAMFILWALFRGVAKANTKHPKSEGFAQVSVGQKIWAIVLFLWTSYMLGRGAHSIVMSFAPPDTTIPKDVFTFGADFLIVITMLLLMTSRAIGGTMLEALHGAARISGMDFDDVFISFFRKKHIIRMICFLLLFRLGEAMLLKLSAPFLIGPRDEGGMGLSLAQYGAAYGTVGVLCLLVGGITGGVVAAKWGLRKWLLPMFLVANLNHLFYVYLAFCRPDNFLTILICVGGEQLGYGFGFTAYMLYMLYIAGDSENKTSHFALCTGFMALSMMLPGMISGAVYELCKSPAVLNLMPASWAAASAGYPLFFVTVVVLLIPGLITLFFIPIEKDFGKKED